MHLKMKRLIEKDENNEFNAIIKLGTYPTEKDAEFAAQIMINILQVAAKDRGIEAKREKTVFIKD